MAITAVITASGQSKRFGEDKAQYTLHGKTLLEHVAASLQHHPHKFLVGDYLLPHWDIIPENYKGCGPLSGLEAALSYSPTEWVAFAAVDVPFLTPEYWAYLASHITPTASMVLCQNHKLEMLAALYHVRILPVVRQNLSLGQYALKSLVNAHAVIVPNSGFDLRNINTRSDLI